jgi:hypothetical protein
VIIRALSLIGIGCLVAAIALLALGSDGDRPVVVILILVAVAISILFGIRRGYQTLRKVASDAAAFASGDVQQARLVDVGEPRGWFNPQSEIQLELEGEDGNVHSIQRGVPVPFPLAWSYRLGKRFNLPLFARIELTEMMAAELKREGMSVSVARPGAAQAP